MKDVNPVLSAMLASRVLGTVMVAVTRQGTAATKTANPAVTGDLAALQDEYRSHYQAMIEGRGDVIEIAKFRNGEVLGHETVPGGRRSPLEPV